MNHVPDSPVNVIGIPELSLLIGDSDVEGPTTTSSRLFSALVWNHGKHSRNFYHREACIPEMTVTNGYSNFYQFCHFIVNIQPVNTQCYHNACPLCRPQQPISRASDVTLCKDPTVLVKKYCIRIMIMLSMESLNDFLLVLINYQSMKSN